MAETKWRCVWGGFLEGKRGTIINIQKGGTTALCTKTWGFALPFALHGVNLQQINKINRKAYETLTFGQRRP